MMLEVPPHFENLLDLYRTSSSTRFTTAIERRGFELGFYKRRTMQENMVGSGRGPRRFSTDV
jgi:hypothetical protein